MIDVEEARRRIGHRVIYRPAHVNGGQPGEPGVVTSVGDRMVFVRYGSDSGSKATPAAYLTWETDRERH